MGWYEDSQKEFVEGYREASCPLCGGHGVVIRRINRPKEQWTDVTECKHCGVNIGKTGEWAGVREKQLISTPRGEPDRFEEKKPDKTWRKKQREKSRY